jgi:hypothetical protein
MKLRNEWQLEQVMHATNGEPARFMAIQSDTTVKKWQSIS